MKSIKLTIAVAAIAATVMSCGGEEAVVETVTEAVELAGPELEEATTESVENELMEENLSELEQEAKELEELFDKIDYHKKFQMYNAHNSQQHQSFKDGK